VEAIQETLMTIRLLVFDIDGVLTDGETRALDLPFLGMLAEMNRKARVDKRRPQVTICTGRPAPYTEAMLQAIDGRLPAIFENGAGLYVPNGYRFWSHPELGDGSAMRSVRRRLEETMVRSGAAYFQPGKIHSLSLFASDPAATGDLRDQATAALGPLLQKVELVYSSSCLNVLPGIIDKGKGLKFLAEQTGYTLDEMLGVGDSDVDLPFLCLVGHSAAPANANPTVKQLVDYVSAHPTSAGTRDILRHHGLGGD
jgi:HAD superfamily hydrolase (TIGR01484 family)